MRLFKRRDPVEKAVEKYVGTAWKQWTTWNHTRHQAPLREFLGEDAEVQDCASVLAETYLMVDMHQAHKETDLLDQAGVLRVALRHPTGVQPLSYGLAMRTLSFESVERDYPVSDEESIRRAVYFIVVPDVKEFWQAPGGSWEKMYNNITNQLNGGGHTETFENRFQVAVSIQGSIDLNKMFSRVTPSPQSGSSSDCYES